MIDYSLSAVHSLCKLALARLNLICLLAGRSERTGPASDMQRAAQADIGSRGAINSIINFHIDYPRELANE